MTTTKKFIFKILSLATTSCCVLTACKSSQQGENTGTDSLQRPPQVQTTDQLRQLGAMSKGWRLQELRFVQPVPSEMQAVVQQAAEEMMLVHRLWLKRDYTYQQELPKLGTQGAARVVRQTGRWSFDEGERRILLTNSDGSPLDTLWVRHLDRDSLVTENGAPGEREIRVYVPF